MNDFIKPQRDMGSNHGAIINTMLKAFRPNITAIYNHLSGFLIAASNPTMQSICLELGATTHADFKLTAILCNIEVAGPGNSIVPKQVVRFVISGPYGSHIDADLLWVEQEDELKHNVDYYAEGVNSYSTVVRLALFIDEIKSIVLGLGALPPAPQSVILLKP